VDRSLFVAGEDEFDGPAHQGVENGNGGSARESKDELHSLVDEDVNQSVCSGLACGGHQNLLKKSEEYLNFSELWFQ
jgi:hypothetical protein